MIRRNFLAILGSLPFIGLAPKPKPWSHFLIPPSCEICRVQL